MSQWAEIRQMHLVDGVPKKEIGRRFGLDVKTVRRAIGRAEPEHQRPSPRRARRLDPCRDEIVELLRSEPRTTTRKTFRSGSATASAPGGRDVHALVDRALLRHPAGGLLFASRGAAALCGGSGRGLHDFEGSGDE